MNCRALPKRLRMTKGPRREEISSIATAPIADPVLIPSSAAPRTVPLVPIVPRRPSHHWTWSLLERGFSPEECAAIRNLAPEVVLDHALRAADEGLKIDAAWFLSVELVAEIERELGPTPSTRLRRLSSDCRAARAMKRCCWC